MQIFIDESKNFTLPREKQSAISCVSCLVIPDHDYEDICRAFESLKAEWGIPGGEVKGRDLNEGEVSSVIRMLNRYDVVFETVAIDMGMETEEGLIAHKNLQVDRLMENVSTDHLPSLVASLKEAQNSFKQMSYQLYVQNSLMIRLVANVLKRATPYYVQRIPSELGWFRWVVDAKDKAVTPCEEFWRKITLPALQSISLGEPIILLRGANYNFFKPYLGELPHRPKHFPKKKTDDERPFSYVEINKISKRFPL